MNSLLEQWNDHIIRGNQLSRELENIEALIEKSKGEDICFTSKPSGATYISVLSPEKLQELRESVVVAIIQVRNEKKEELEKLMGIRKPAILNPAFEAAVQDMEASVPKKEHIVQDNEVVSPKKIIEKKPEINVADVQRMYHDEAKTMKEIADHFGVKKEQVNSFIQKNNLRRTSYMKDDIFLDTKVKARQSKTK